MYVDDEPAQAKPKKPRKKVEKKVVPVGRNGLKKKRVVKSKMSLDAKGYMGREKNVCVQVPRLTSLSFSDRGLFIVRVRRRRGTRRARKA